MDKLMVMAERIKKEHVTGKETEEHFECPICRDRGYVIETDDYGIEYAVDCKCLEIRKAREMMEKSGISEEFSRKTFENFITNDNPQLVNAKTKAMRFVQNFRQKEHARYNSMMFCGQVGAGKTHLGTAACGQLMRDGVAVVYMPYRNAVTKIKQNVTDETGYGREMSRYMSARVLYIDDFLKGKLGADINIIYEIVNHRYMNNLPLIISTEKYPAELLEFDEAIGSRLIEMCKGNIVQFSGRELNYRLG